MLDDENYWNMIHTAADVIMHLIEKTIVKIKNEIPCYWRQGIKQKQRDAFMAIWNIYNVIGGQSSLQLKE